MMQTLIARQQLLSATTNTSLGVVVGGASRARVEHDDLDARTKETAATLVDVTKLHRDARTVRLLPPPQQNRNSNASSVAAELMQQQHHQQQQCREVSRGTMASPTRTTSISTHTTTTTEYSILMTTIGLGIDPFFGATSSTTNATVAAVKAVRDAMERGILRFPSDHSNLYLHIQLGVPPRIAGRSEPMHVDLGHLTPLLPSFIPLLPVDIVVGGLLVSNHLNTNASPMQSNAGMTPPNAACTAVACITLHRAKQIEANNQSSHCVLGSPTSVTTPGQHHGDSHYSHPSSSWAHEEDQEHDQVSHEQEEAEEEEDEEEEEHGDGVSAMEESQPEPSVEEDRATLAAARALSNASHQAKRMYHRSTSIEMLAHVSAELHIEDIPRGNGGAGHKRTQSHLQEEESLATTTTNATAENVASMMAGSNYNYKKLPPGMTTKKNKRLFVQHNYKDHSQELPLSDELDLLGPNAPSRTSNAAFPLKLHETLSLIEREGNSHIIGWLPHGRSFKIHRQKEFVELVLPKYFVMTKKSSFLRQLNLYGFNRLSGVGPDQGSYYHEKFLRGMKFLCRRIHRQKVNGNGIRAAGNPDGEPNLNNFPTCPPIPEGLQQPILQQTVRPAPVQLQTTVSPPPAPLVYLQESQAANLVDRQAFHRRLIQASAKLNAFTGHLTAASLAQQQQNQHRHPLLQPQQPEIQERRQQQHNTQATQVQDFESNEDTDDEEGNCEPAASGAETYSRDNTSSHTANNGALSAASFPLKLQRILDKLESENTADIISWLPHGRAFIVYNVERFVNELMPLYFNQTKYSSFQRQLHMYHFQRITAGRDKGAYHHPSFQRGRPELCLGMTRTRVNGKGTRRPGNPEKEPDFYELGSLPSIPPGSKIEIPLSHEQSNFSGINLLSSPGTQDDYSSHSHDSRSRSNSYGTDGS